MLKVTLKRDINLEMKPNIGLITKEIGKGLGPKLNNITNLKEFPKCPSLQSGC